MKLSQIKYFILAIVVSVAGLSISPNLSSAITKEEMIQNIMKQIKLLQEQLAQLRGSSDSSSRQCYNFDRNLKFGDSGEGIANLKQALDKEGFELGNDLNNNKFTEITASFVSAFQEKYKDEILTPNGFRYGTGFVGKATRAKLNQLYRCGNNNSSSSSISSSSNTSITVLSPNGGEKLEIGKTYQIKWNVKDLDVSNFGPVNVDIVSYHYSEKGDGVDSTRKNIIVIPRIYNTENYYNWTITDSFLRDIINTNFLFDWKFKIEVYAQQKGGTPSDSSDGYFNILKDQTLSGLNISLSSTSGPVGTEVSIDNVYSGQLHFGNGIIPSSDIKFIQIMDYPSSHRAMLFKIPEYVNPACYYSEPKCLMPAIKVIPGVYPVYISTPDGKISNKINFTVL